MNPQKALFHKEYCKRHPTNTYQFICDLENCDYYLQFQCFQCRQERTLDHAHLCGKSATFVRALHGRVVRDLTGQVRKGIQGFRGEVLAEIDRLVGELEGWYSPMDDTTTEKEFVHTVENPSKWDKLAQTADIKNSLIKSRLQACSIKFRKQLQQITKIVDLQMSELKYRPAPLEWKFDRSHIHELLSISGFKDRSVDKKSQKQKYCIAMLNQPLTPIKNEISFTINSQNPYQHYIVVGVCSKRQLIRDFYQTDLKKGIVAIYQAAKAGNTNNALSLNGFDEAMHYKEAVGWNFRTGDLITITYSIVEGDQVRIQFKKKKEVFDLMVKKCNAFLHPFVALYSTGDKVSIDLS